ncbi:hypothetical protein MPTK1_5g19120 [Marchantia polymorpha subsp. ruderalis]|uniref:Uncharacterized protein n=2 Tax=Marchantia polymorpha TaxID=3197 RepID=A0AAF6BJY6_MARPO|nr:hypothetical protein MARPO_0073s0031 [Marchantia polymorpha]BBN12320.1 hypothetical protein Mp_5g19120 [Marchantia polymorpha subsp. ruderalis]|eukprot:PTQ35154.1 hypothetical protein MARPO_0073s0031 [Marchantia polymorpha]
MCICSTIKTRSGICSFSSVKGELTTKLSSFINHGFTRIHRRTGRHGRGKLVERGLWEHARGRHLPLASSKIWRLGCPGGWNWRHCHYGSSQIAFIIIFVVARHEQ